MLGQDTTNRASNCALVCASGDTNAKSCRLVTGAFDFRTLHSGYAQEILLQ